MKMGRRFVAAMAVSSLLAVGFSVGGATTTAYAAGSNSATTGSLASFCSELAAHIDRLDPPETRLQAVLLRIALAVQAKYCG